MEKDEEEENRERRVALEGLDNVIFNSKEKQDERTNR